MFVAVFYLSQGWLVYSHCGTIVMYIFGSLFLIAHTIQIVIMCEETYKICTLINPKLVTTVVGLHALLIGPISSIVEYSTSAILNHETAEWSMVGVTYVTFWYLLNVINTSVLESKLRSTGLYEKMEALRRGEVVVSKDEKEEIANSNKN